MKRLVFLLLSFVFEFSAINAQWIQTNGPYGAYIDVLTIDNNTIYVGTRGNGIWQSTNNGSSWQEINNGLPDDMPSSYVYSIAVNGDKIFAGMYDGIYRSTNGGSNWKIINNSSLPSYTFVNSFAFLENDIYAGSHDGVFISKDNGISWNEINNGFDDIGVNPLIVKDNNIFAGGYDGIYLLRESDSSWNKVLDLGNSIEDIKVDQDNIFAICSTGKIFLSTNDGLSWSNISIPSLVGYGFALTVNNGNVFASTSAGIFISKDKGSTWEEVNNGLPKADVTSLSSNENGIFAGTKYGVWFSSDGGIQWQESNNGFVVPNTYSITTCGNNIISETDFGIYFSSDLGNNWIPSKNNNGWGTSLSNISSLSFYENNIVTETVDGYYFSIDNGNNWNKINSWPGGDLLCIYDNNIYTGTTSGLYLSTDNGTSWNLLNNGLPDKSIHTYSVLGNTFVAGYYDGDGIYISTNNGENWNKAMESPRILSLAIDKNNIFAGTVYGMFLSTDNGSTWNEIGNIDYVSSFCFSNDNIFVSNYSGVYLSTDYGSSWNKVNEGFPSKNYLPPSKDINTIKIIGVYIYAGTDDGSGIWFRPISELITEVNNDLNQERYYFLLSQNYPNPFNPTTTINFQLPKAGNVSLNVYDALGRLVRTLVTDYKSEGRYSIEFSANNLASGLYFYELRSGDYVSTKKMILIK